MDDKKCSVCSMEVEDVKMHVKEEADKKDEGHLAAWKMMQEHMGKDDHTGHSH